MSSFRQYSQAQALVLDLHRTSIPVLNFEHGLICSTTTRPIPSSVASQNRIRFPIDVESQPIGLFAARQPLKGISNPDMNAASWKIRLSAVVAVGALGAGLCMLAMPRAANGASAYTLTPTTFGMQVKTPDGRVVFEYLTKKPDNVKLTSESAACFHPVNTPSGERVTALAPDDHPHHRGIFLGWQASEFRVPSDLSNYGPHAPLRALNISRADFWGWGEFAPRDGRLVQNSEVKLVRADASQAVVEIRNEWFVRKQKHLDEINIATASERDGVFVLDLEYRLTPTGDYSLDRASFGGFSVQARKDGEPYFADAAGKVQFPDPHYSMPDSNWPGAPWYDYTIRVKDSGKVLGVAVIDHPRNPTTTWHNSTRLWMVHPVITANGPFVISHGETLVLRYRVVTHDGETPTAVLQKLSAEYRGGR